MLNEQSPIALYHQLKEHMMAKIRLGEWEPDEKIPTERKLCSIYGVSRITVRQALDELAKEGYIYKKQGKGTFIRARKYEQHLGSLYSFSEEIKKMGSIPSSTILDFHVEGVSQLVAAKVGLTSGDPVYILKRLRNADNDPYAIEYSYIPCRLVKGLTLEDLEKKGLYKSIKERCGIVPTQAIETFEAIILPDEHCKNLKVKRSSAGFLIERITNCDGIPMEFCNSYVRGDKYKYQIVLNKSN